MGEEELITVREAAAIAQVSRGTILYWIKTDILEAASKTTKGYLISGRALAKLLQRLGPPKQIERSRLGARHTMNRRRSRLAS